MRVHTKCVYEWKKDKLVLVHEEGFEYSGPIAMCGGGPSSTQQAAQQQQLSNAQQEGALANSSTQKFNSLYGSTQPFYQNEQQNGLPFYNNLTDFASGTAAQAYDPAKASFLRQSSSMGALPSGFKASGMNDINESQSKMFDQSLTGNMFAQQQAKQQGAAGHAGLMQTVNPSAFYGGSSSAAQGATQPLQAANNPWMGILGSAVQGASSAIPF
jgi:hypothetical protein